MLIRKRIVDGCDMPAVSVIIAVYNVEAYLRRCLDTVRGQVLRDIEIICVDDGSTDGSPQVLAEYAAKDPRMRIVHQTNMGAGRARNAGLGHATGRWLAFWDADDEFAAEMLSEMVDAGERSGAEVVACTVAPHGDMFRRWRGWAWDKLFRRDFVERLGLEFQDLPVSNDLLFTYSALALADKVEPIGKSYVFHRKRQGSIETSRDRAPLAPLAAVKALYAKIGLVAGFSRWIPDFLFWHINRLKSADARRMLYRETRKLGRELGIRSTPKWILEEIKHAVKMLIRKLGLVECAFASS